MSKRMMMQCNVDTVCALKVIQARLQQQLKRNVSLADVLDMVLRHDPIVLAIIKANNIEF